MQQRMDLSNTEKSEYRVIANGVKEIATVNH